MLAHWLAGTPHNAAKIPPAASLCTICTADTIGRVELDARRAGVGAAKTTITPLRPSARPRPSLTYPTGMHDMASNIAVLTNDLQYELVNKNPERIRAVADAKDNFRRFLDGMRDRGCEIVHLQLINREDDANAERYNGYLPVTKGSEGAQIIADFLVESDLVVEKNKDSGFYETDLHEMLQARGVDTVVVTGMQTQICVQTTAADAFFRGYNIWVPSDCVVSAQETDKKRALEWLDAYCATVTGSAEVLRTIDAFGRLPRKVIKTP
ncbi:isochorismatase family cysteine hydrolase [Paraburkholderia sabiae]|uniref:Isochorismatase family cysteine hydrolase n=3 Tax=Paraburkholderia sabiae TaxID=273251 RepID=A0ABU9QRN6_9BURK|nr:isochorismatase family cysteine hydrolase [Paraburkholderia sabiae]